MWVNERNDLVLELIVWKENNDLFDLSIAYGLLSILEENFIYGKLKNHKSAFVVECEEFDIEDTEFFVDRSSIDDNVEFGKMMNSTNKKIYLSQLFGDENGEGKLLTTDLIRDSLSYYSQRKTIEDMDKNHVKDASHAFIGNPYSVKGQRKSVKSATGQKGPLFEVLLSKLGFIRATSFVSVNGEKFLTWLPLPSSEGIEEIRRFDFLPPEPNEDGELKRKRYTSSKAITISLAQILLSTQYQMTIDNIKDGYDGLIVVETSDAGNSFMNGFNYILEWTTFSSSNLLKNRKILNIDSNISINIPFSNWITSRREEYFSSYIKELNKENKSISYEESKESARMASIAELYNNEGVKILGRRLYQLQRNKKGYNVLNSMMSVTNQSELMSAVSLLSVEYNKKQGYALWDEKQQEEFLNSLGEFSGKEVASAILLHSATRKEVKKEENVDNEAK